MSEINTYTTLFKTKKTVFSVDDLSLIWPNLSRDVLLDKIKNLSNKNKLYRLKRGLYSLPDREVNLLELGTKIKNPSYISFYTVLTKAGIVFQYYKSIYLASNNSITLQTQNQSYIYKKLGDEILFNSKGIKKEENYQIATPERAYLDTLYLNPGQGFDNEEKLDYNYCLELIDIYKNNRLFKELKVRFKK